MAQAVNEALAEEMARDDTVFLWGEDVTLGGYFNVTEGLVDRFGKNRAGEYTLPLGKALIRKSGQDVTIVTHLLGVGISLEAAEMVKANGISVEVIDLCTLYPMDTLTILHSVKKTGRLITVEEGPCTGGIGAEVIARVAAAGFDVLKTAPVRIAAPECPIPYAKNLENAMMPTPDRIAEAIRKIIY